METEEAKKGPEMSANISKIAKVTGIFFCQLNTPVTNIAKISEIRNLTRIKTYQQKKPTRALKCPQISQKSQK